MKYLRTFLIGIQVQLQYRADLIMWFIVGTLPAFALILVWFAILGNNTSIKGFSKGDFIVYYFFQTISWYIVGGSFSRWLGRNIKKGDVTTTLLKPYNVVFATALREQAWKLSSILCALPAIFIIFFLFRDIIHLHFSAIQFIELIVSLFLGGIIFALIEAVVGCTAFWITNVWPVADAFDIALGLFGGRLIPITLMPLYLQNIATFLPFKYIFYIPISILLNKNSTPVFDIGIQCVFIIVIFCIYKCVWSAGLKKYEAIGG